MHMMCWTPSLCFSLVSLVRLVYGPLLPNPDSSNPSICFLVQRNSPKHSVGATLGFFSFYLFSMAIMLVCCADVAVRYYQKTLVRLENVLPLLRGMLLYPVAEVVTWLPILAYVSNSHDITLQATELNRLLLVASISAVLMSTIFFAHSEEMRRLWLRLCIAQSAPRGDNNTGEGEGEGEHDEEAGEKRRDDLNSKVPDVHPTPSLVTGATSINNLQGGQSALATASKSHSRTSARKDEYINPDFAAEGEGEREGDWGVFGEQVWEMAKKRASVVGARIASIRTTFAASDVHEHGRGVSAIGDIHTNITRSPIGSPGNAAGSRDLMSLSSSSASSSLPSSSPLDAASLSGGDIVLRSL